MVDDGLAICVQARDGVEGVLEGAGGEAGAVPVVDLGGMHRASRGEEGGDLQIAAAAGVGQGGQADLEAGAKVERDLGGCGQFQRGDGGQVKDVGRGEGGDPGGILAVEHQVFKPVAGQVAQEISRLGHVLEVEIAGQRVDLHTGGRFAHPQVSTASAGDLDETAAQLTGQGRHFVDVELEAGFVLAEPGGQIVYAHLACQEGLVDEGGIGAGGGGVIQAGQGIGHAPAPLFSLKHQGIAQEGLLLGQVQGPVPLGGAGGGGFGFEQGNEAGGIFCSPRGIDAVAVIFFERCSDG